jgi:hypothetical protein
MSVLAAPTVRVRRKKQTPEEAAEVYRYVTARDVFCRAPLIEEGLSGEEFIEMRLKCDHKTERHHAGNTIGSKRITDARHVCLLCQFHHATWAPSHSRLILEYLDRIETQRERGGA